MHEPETNCTDNETKSKPPVDKLKAMSEGSLRASFRRKVYGIVTAQLFVTAVVASTCALQPRIRDLMVSMAMSNSRWLQFAILIPTLASLMALSLGAKKHFPANYIFLSVFTLSISTNVGCVCAVFYAAGLGSLILQAGGITLMIFLGLTAYTLWSGKDFSYIGGFLSIALWGLVITSFAGLFFPSLVCNVGFSCIGAMTFCGYIIFDTWRLEKKFGYDDYIEATIEIYLDIINLFLYVLKILKELQKNKR